MAAALLALGCAPGLPVAWAGELPASVAAVQFDPAFLSDKSVDVRRFEQANAVLPGVYAVELFVNDQSVARSDVRFLSEPGSLGARPCLTGTLLRMAGLDMRQLGLPGPGAQQDQPAQADGGQCIDLARRIPDAAVYYDVAEQQLTLSIPQAALRRTARGEVDPSLWSEGIAAGLLRYDGNVYRIRGGNMTSTSGYLGLVAGANLGGWRLRQRSSLNYSEQARRRDLFADRDDASGRRYGHVHDDGHAGVRFQSMETYAQHDLTNWKSTFTVGDSTTSGNVFDSFSLRGIQLVSDDRMYPNSLRGYAPVVRGVAHSNAKVDVRQNGYVIYQTTVAPGAFSLDDLNPTGYGGDLEVVVTEADGSRQTFSVPYSSVPQLLRPGRSSYSAAFGEHRAQYQEGSRNYVGQLVYQRGISDLFTGYAGALGATGYGAALVGSALNTHWGAIALDVTAARTALPEHGSSSGQSWRLSYAKILPQTDTSLTLAAYRYSTSGFYSLADALQSRETDHPRRYAQDYRTRDRMQLNISQRIGTGGSLYAMGMLTSYWVDRSRDTQFQVGYANGLGWGSYSVSLQRTRDVYGQQSNQVYASLSVPFGGRVDRSPPFSSLSASMTQDARGTALQTSASGTAGVNNAWSYGMNADYADRGGGRATALGGYGSYSGGQGTANASASAGAQSSQFSLGGSGSMVLHSGGLTFGQATNADSPVGLVRADGAAGAIVTNAAGVVVDARGYAVVPYLTPYQVNQLELDPQGMADDVELKSTRQDVVPRAGAVVRATFETQRGAPLVLRVSRADGRVVPMGADVLDARDRQVGVVGQGGMVFVRGVPDRGTLIVRWGTRASGQCAFPYQRTDGNAGTALACTPAAAPGPQRPAVGLAASLLLP